MSWNDDANWSGTGFPNAIGDVANMNVDLSANQVVNLNQAITVGSLTIGDSNGSQTATLNPNGGSLTFDVASGNASLTRTATGTGAVTISSGITLNDNLAVSLASGTATSTMTLSGVVAGTSTGITKTGSTLTLALSGNNSYSGVTAINAGTIAISSSNALGATGSGNHTTIAAIGSGTTQLRLSNNITSAEDITLTGSTESGVYTGVIHNISGTNTLTGSITLAGSGGLKISAPGGTLNLNGTITQTGTSHQFILQPFSGTSVINVANPIANNRGGLLLVGLNSGDGALVTLNGASGSGIGDTTLAQRVTLRLGVSDALNTAANLTVSYGGTNTGEDRATLDLRGFNQTVNALIGNVGSSNSSANSFRLITNGAASGTSIFTVGNGNGSGTFNGQINNGTTASIQLIKTGTGNQTLNDQNSYTGGTRIDGGTLTLGHATNTLANTGAINVNGGTLALGSNSDTVGAVTLTSGSITGSGGTLTGTGSGYDVRSGSVTAILGGSIGLTKTTAGTVTLSGANTYAGSTIVDGGTLALTSTGSIAAASNVQVNSGTLSITEGGGGRTFANTIVLNGGTVQSLQDNTGTGGTITLSGGNVIHTFTASGTLGLPVAVGSASQLIVVGGGGGGGGTSGTAYNAGGGGGQVRNLTGQTLAAGNTPVTVGAGGTAGDNTNGADGGASSIGSNTALGGGGAKTTVTGTGGTSGSGNAGGVRNVSAAGGGGGNSAAGSNAPTSTGGGNGGAGTVGVITGLTYGGGGGGSAFTTAGTGGAGGGGNGGINGIGTAGAANRGGGGGGGAAGGSGIAIVQYAYATTAGAVTLSGSIDLQSASALDAHGSGGLLSVNGLISSSTGTGGLTIASSDSAGGVVRFGSANTYVGNTTVNTGATLRMNTTNALPYGSGKGSLSLSGTLDLNGQTNTSLNGLSGVGTIDNTSGAGTFTLSVGNDDQTSTFGGVIQNTTGAIALTKVGTGTLTLSGSNTYTGVTNVNAGTLLINGDNSGATGAISVAASAYLGGTGTIGGDLTFAATSLFDIEDINDPLAVNGTVLFGSGFGIANLAGIDWDSLALGTPYTLISTSQTFTSGDIANFGLAHAAPVGTGRSAYFQDGSLQLVVVPEPTTIALLGAGVALLGFRVARRRKA